MGIKQLRFRGLRGTGRSVVTTVAALACLFLAPAAAQAASFGPTDGQISAAQQAASVAATRVGELGAELAVAQSSVAHAEALANIALGKFEATQADYSTAQAAAQQAEDAAGRAEAALADAQAEVAAFARSSYLEGSTSPGFAAALAADGPEQMLERRSLLAAANTHRTDVLAQMTAAQQQAAAARQAATTALATAAAVQRRAQAELSAASRLENHARQAAAAISARRTGLQAQLVSAQQTLLGLEGARAAAIADQQRKAAAAAAAASSGSYDVAAISNRGSTPAARAAIRAALRWVGQMYAWGGGSTSGPSEGWGPDVGVVGFDCSGLTRYAYAQAGIAIPRVAADQFAALPKVTHLRPGDLAFYATDPNDPSTIHHVVMYLGKGQIIEAPESGERVHVTSMRYGYEYIGAVRPSG